MMGRDGGATKQRRCIMGTGEASPVQVVRLDEDRGDEVTALMGRAFQEDPLFVHACPDADERAAWTPWLFRWPTRAGVLFGQTLGTVVRLDGVVAMIGPGGAAFSEEQSVQCGYRHGREVVGTAVWDRSIIALDEALEPAHEALHQTVPELHWLLDVIAVEPAQQGRGVGSALLRAVSERADADRTPIALMTYNPANLGIYQHFGYGVVCEGRVSGSGVPWWGMRRDPGSSR
jgi:GNAT superfamily N-acetyltransferase